MPKSYLYLSAVVLALHGHGASGREAASRLLDPSPLSGETTVHPVARNIVAQSNSAAAPAATTQPGATMPSQRTETINYENWILTCREFLDGPKKRSCATTVAVQRAETGQTVIALTVQLNEQGRPVATIQTPTGVAIAPGVEIKLERGNSRKLAFEFCDTARCVASTSADGAALTRDLAASSKVTVTVQSPDGKPVNFEFPIKGFEKAYAGVAKG